LLADIGHVVGKVQLQDLEPCPCVKLSAVSKLAVREEDLGRKNNKARVKMLDYVHFEA